MCLKQTSRRHDRTFQPPRISFLHHPVPLSNVVSNDVKSRASPTNEVERPIYVRTLSSHPRLRLNLPARFAVNKSTRVGFVSRTRSRRFNYRRIRDEIFNSTSRILVGRGSHEPPGRRKKMLIPRDEDGHLVAIALKYRDYFAPSPFLPRRRRVAQRCFVSIYNEISIEAAARSN